MYKFYMPTKVMAGQHCIKKNGKELRGLGSKALIVTGKSSGRKSGALQDMIETLTEQAIDYVLFERVENNPTLENVTEAAEVARANQVDLIIGIGGGSPLDAAKAVAVLATNNIPAIQLYDGYEHHPLPIVAVPTTAGTGSEVTPYSVMTLKNMQSKKGFASEHIFPKLAFLDERYTEMLPLKVTIHTAIDALSHAIEGYLATRRSTAVEYIALESIRLFAESIDPLKQGLLSLEDREKLLRASMLAGIVIAHTGTTIVHSMGYNLTYFKGIPHGHANGLLLAAYLKLNQQVVPERVGLILERLGFSEIDQFAQLMELLLGDEVSLSKAEIEQYVEISSRAAAAIANTPSPMTRIEQTWMFEQI